MGADQVLELEVVTADGRLLVANECTNEDLFWAVRGVGNTYLEISRLGLLTISRAGQFLV